MTTLNIRIRALEHNIEIIKSLAADAQIIAVLKGNAYGLGPVSYTHLTLPTKRIVEISVGAVTLKKKKKEPMNELLRLKQNNRSRQ